MRYAFTMFLAGAVAGCSFVNDPDVHTGGTPSDAGAGTSDGGGSVDGGVPDEDGGGVDAGGVDAGPPQPIPAADFCSELVAAYCEARIACCSAAAGKDFDTCRANQAMACANGLGRVATDPRSNYDPDQARRVVDELRRLYMASCDTEIIDTLVSRSAGILSVYRGTIPIGTTCSVLDPGSYYGCLRPGWCRRQAFGHQCQSLSPVGMNCRDDIDCVDGAWCSMSTMREGRCMARLRDAAPCSRSNQCQSLICSGSDTMPGTCQPRTRDVYCFEPFDG